MASRALSKAERKELKKRIPARARFARGEGVVREGRPAEATDDRHDGLDWLIRKGRLTAAQKDVAQRYRSGYRDAGEVSTRSCLEVGVGGGGGVGMLSPVEVMSEARRQLFVWRYAVLRGQVDMLTVLDGVCGVGHTVRYLAAGHQPRSRELEAILRVALDMLVAFEAGPPEIVIEGRLRN